MSALDPKKPRKSASRAAWGKVRKLPSGRYQASYLSPDGSRYNAPMTYVAKGDARAWLSRQQTVIADGKWVSPEQAALDAAAAIKQAKAETFGIYATTWVAQRVTSNGAPLRVKTRTEYERQLARGLAIFSDDALKAITAARVREWHTARMQDGGATAAGAEARLLRAILNTAITDGIIETNPVPGNLTRTQTGVKHRPPTLDELGTVLSTIDPHYRLAVILAAYGNVRLSEWRALRRGDLTKQGDRIFVNVTRQAQHIAKKGWHVGPPKSAEGERVVPLPAAFTADVEQHLATYVGPFAESLLFAPRGHSEFVHDRQFNDAWNIARDAAGIRSVVREHDLRAFALTAFAQAGATLRETQKFGGHATVDAAMKYQHAAAERMADLVDQMPLPETQAKVIPLAR